MEKQLDDKSVSEGSETEPESDSSEGMELDSGPIHTDSALASSSSNKSTKEHSETVTQMGPGLSLDVLSNACVDVSVKKRRKAAWNRRARAKKRMEKELLNLQNWKLEEEKDKYRRWIGSLQNQIQALKRNRETTFERERLVLENRLLRAELKKAKIAVNKIKEIIKSAGPDFRKAEKLRILSTGIQSTVGQMLGLGYVSLFDDSWHSITVPLSADMIRTESGFVGDRNVYLRYQYLPHGASRNDATRVNIRMDFFNIIKGNPKEIAKKMKMSMNSNKAWVEELARYLKLDRSSVKFTWKEIDDFSKDIKNDAGLMSAECKLFQYSEEYEITDSVDGSLIVYRKNALFMSALDSVLLFVDAFPKSPERFPKRLNNDQDSVDSNEKVPGFVVSWAGFRQEVDNGNESVQVPSDFSNFQQFIDAYILDASETPGMTNIRAIHSYELNNKGDALAFQDPKVLHPVTESGDVNTALVFAEHMKVLLKGVEQLT
uniref:BZIP domain-containing protein n=1 Tax=Aplanochytrium stocchinoi TaxID=215587 RepID=A0A7S3LJP6_9STRA